MSGTVLAQGPSEVRQPVQSKSPLHIACLQMYERITLHIYCDAHKLIIETWLVISTRWHPPFLQQFSPLFNGMTPRQNRTTINVTSDTTSRAPQATTGIGRAVPMPPSTTIFIPRHFNHHLANANSDTSYESRHAGTSYTSVSQASTT